MKPHFAALAAPRRIPHLVVVSPHLDDAVLGCGSLLASFGGSVVCTVFAGEPAVARRTPWDEASGFRDSHEAMRARPREDECALACCGAKPLRLKFVDAQYGAEEPPETIAAALAEVFERVGQHGRFLPVFPLGLWHRDHECVGAACRLLLRTRRIAECIAYEDAIFRAIPGALDEGLARIEAALLCASPWHPHALDASPGRQLAALKRRAVGAYPSQLRAFGHYPPDVARAERYWRLAPRS
ncbi:PIG-L deacetylase family protein [Paraburkholderia sacchari]|uniref:PIG-L family deacetylase n=1 Tax=Paraburkholderia sacchari TaxID=159450 RepID=A0A8T6Z7U9_9BURK|nr:PIG-L family deacetylase [Paraburkholderia sacchari]NLP60274.1 PIG-L family deacetylase [Paraburkholderia sacchari]